MSGDSMESLFADGNLTFVGQDVECIPLWLSTKYGVQTKRLDLSYNRLRSVKGLVGFDNLVELVLDNNNLSDDIEFPLMGRLETLTLNKNNLKNLENFLDKISEKLPSLTYLSLLGNQACPNQLSSSDKDEEDYQRYRYYVLYRVPKLKFLDSTPVSREERQEAARVGQFMKLITSSTNEAEEEGDERSASKAKVTAEQYSPLPTSDSREGEHKSTFGKSRYVYYGKHSEGNRFILNSDL